MDVVAASMGSLLSSNAPEAFGDRRLFRGPSSALESMACSERMRHGYDWGLFGV